MMMMMMMMKEDEEEEQPQLQKEDEKNKKATRMQYPAPHRRTKPKPRRKKEGLESRQSPARKSERRGEEDVARATPPSIWPRAGPIRPTATRSSSPLSSPRG